MLKICDEYSKGFDIVFNAKKSKCMFIRERRNASGPVVPMPFFSIGGIQIELVNQWPHLGHSITDSLDDNNDIAVRCNILCGQINNIICYFANLDAVTKLKLFNPLTARHFFFTLSFGAGQIFSFLIPGAG